MLVCRVVVVVVALASLLRAWSLERALQSVSRTNTSVARFSDNWYLRCSRSTPTTDFRHSASNCARHQGGDLTVKFVLADMSSGGRDGGQDGPRLFCTPSKGAREPAVRTFLQDFEACASAYYVQDDEYSIWEALNDTDQGGTDPNADAMPGPNQNGHTNAMRRRKRRQNTAYKIAYNHVDNVRIRELFAAVPKDNRRGVNAWIIFIRECGEDSNDLQVLSIKLDFTGASIEKDVGYSDETITIFSRLLLSINARLPLPHKYSNNELCLKILSQITHPESLAHEAVTEIKAAAGSRRFEVVINAVPERDFTSLVIHFDQMWRGLFSQGIIRMRVAGKKNDAGALLVAEDDAMNVYDGQPDPDDDAADTDDAYAVVRHRPGKGGGRFNSFASRGRGFRGGGRGGRGARGGGAHAHAHAQTSDRPRLCNDCWPLIRNASHAQKMALIQAILGQPFARAYLAEEAAEEGEEDEQARHATEHIANLQLTNEAARNVEHDDDMVEDYVIRVVEDGDMRHHANDAAAEAELTAQRPYQRARMLAGIGRLMAQHYNDEGANADHEAYLSEQAKIIQRAARGRIARVRLGVSPKLFLFDGYLWNESLLLREVNDGLEDVTLSDEEPTSHELASDSDTDDHVTSTTMGVHNLGMYGPFMFYPPIERVNDNTTLVMLAERGGMPIGVGLFAARDLPTGSRVAIFGEGGVMPIERWEAYRVVRNLPHDSKFESTRTVHDVLYDRSWDDNRVRMDSEGLLWPPRRPKWYAMNHSKHRPNVKIALPDARPIRGTWRGLMANDDVEWVTMRPIAAGEELMFDYGADTQEWDDKEWQVLYADGGSRRSADKKWAAYINSPKPPNSPNHVVYGAHRNWNTPHQRPIDHSTSMSNRNKNMWGPYEHRVGEGFTHSSGAHYSAVDGDYAEAYARDHAYPLLAIPQRERQRRAPSADDAPPDRHPNPLVRLRSMLLCMQHMRRKASARVLELRRRFSDGWNCLRGAPFKRPTWQQRKPTGEHAEDCKRRSAEWYDRASPVSNDPAVGVSGACGRWVADSGCTVHCVSSVADLTGVISRGSDRPLRVADKRFVNVTHTGYIDRPVMAVAADGTVVRDRIHLHRVLVVPSFRDRLYSCGTGHSRDGMRTVLDGKDGKQGYIELPSGNRLYFKDGPDKYVFDVVDASVRTSQSYAVAEADGLLNHRRLAHFSGARLRDSGIAGGHNPLDCPACRINLKRKAMPSRSKVQRGEPPRAQRFGQRINSDVLTMPESIEGYRSIITFVDEASSEPDIRFLKAHTATAVLHALESFVAEHKHLMDGGRVGTWHADNGGEFDEAGIDEFCNRMSTHQTRTTAHTPELNGKAERFNGILVRAIRILLAESNLTEGLWPYAASHVTHIHKRLVSRALDPPISPYEFNRQRKPSLEKYRVWGCRCYVHLEAEERNKFGLLKTDPSGMLAVHLGYDHRRHGYYVYISQIRRYTTVRSITFDEHKWCDVPELSRHERVVPGQSKARSREELERVQAGVGGVRRGRPTTINSPNVANLVACARHSVVFAVNESGPVPEPKSYQEAISGKHAKQWIDAMIADIKGKKENGPRGAWDLVPMEEARKLGRTPLKGKWVYKIKYEPDGYTILKFKARWVGCGFAQQAKIDYGETFASTIRAVTVRILFAEAAACDLMLGVFDVKLAFTQSEMTETLYVDQPTGFEVPGKVCRLNMALEGTKQAAHLWQQNLNEFMISHKFERSLADPCLYKLVDGESYVKCAVHVDDLLCAYNDNAQYEEFWVAFSKRFKATRSTVETYLGMEVWRDRDARRLVLTQSVYLEKIFGKYLSGHNTKAWSTPVDLGRDAVAKFYAIECAATEKEVNEMAGKDFNGLLGSILYASCMTRPDIAFFAAFLCQFMQNPSLAAWEAALSVASYLNTTKHLGVAYNGDSLSVNISDIDTTFERLVVFSDASFGREIHPFAGGFVQWRNGPVSWLCRKAKFVAQSSCEIEVFGMVMLMKEAEFADQVCKFLGAGIGGPMAAVTDNKAARDVVKCPGATKRTVHFDRWLHFARELTLRNKAEVFLAGTDDMMADGFTKPVDKTKFLKCRQYLMSSRAGGD